MRKQKNRDLHREITKRFIDALKADRVPWIKPWKTDSGSADGFPVNAATGRRYSGINVPILWSSAIERGYGRDRWLTYRQVIKAGGYVRRGEKGTLVVFYRTIEKKKTADESVLSDDEPKTFRIARSFTLFNVEQCEDLPASIIGDAIVDVLDRGTEFPDVEELITRCGVKVRHGGNIATYDAAADVIQMPPAQDFESPEHYYATLLHELTHWSGHKKRLNRAAIVESCPYNSRSYAFEELIAEIGSAFLCAEFGITGDLRHESYVADWIKLMEDAPRAIFQASATAQSAFDYLTSIGVEQEKAA